MRIIKRLPLLPIFLLFLIIVQSCSENERSTIYSTEENGEERNLSLEYFGDSFVKANLHVDWNRYAFYISETGQEIREYRTFSDANRVLNQGDIEIDLKYSILATKDKDSKIWDYSVLKYIAGDGGSLQQASFFEKAGFSGPLYFYDLKGRTTKIEGYTKGELISTFTDRKKGFVTTTSKDPAISCGGFDEPDCTSGGGSGGGWQTVVVKHYTDWYNVRLNGHPDYNQ